jgi:hypothetical protein
MTIDELPGVFFRGLIVGAYELDCAADMATLVKNVRSILGHVRPPQGNLSSTEIVFWQFGSRLETKLKT